MPGCLLLVLGLRGASASDWAHSPPKTNTNPPVGWSEGGGRREGEGWLVQTWLHHVLLRAYGQHDFPRGGSLTTDRRVASRVFAHQSEISVRPHRLQHHVAATQKNVHQGPSPLSGCDLPGATPGILGKPKKKGGGRGRGGSSSKRGGLSLFLYRVTVDKQQSSLLLYALYYGKLYAI